ITTEIMSAIYEEITIDMVASTLLKQFPDSINYTFRTFHNSISLVGTLAKYSIPVQDALQLYSISTKISEQTITGAELFPENANSILVTSTIERAGTIYIGDEKFGSISSRSDSNSYIIAAFVDEKMTKAEVMSENSRSHIDFETVEHLLAFVDWYKTSSCCNHFHIYNHKTDCFQFDEGGCAYVEMF
ncbi:6709_t:CDS:2, partial [Racocetra persica]